MRKLYSGTQEKRIAKEITYKGYNAIIIDYGSHPCGYVEIPKENKLFEQDYFDEDIEQINCHGGITFSRFYDFGYGNKYYIGWDYAHFDDYISNAFGLCGNKKWTIKEIEEEAKNVIKQIIELNK